MYLVNNGANTTFHEDVVHSPLHVCPLPHFDVPFKKFWLLINTKFCILRTPFPKWKASSRCLWQQVTQLSLSGGVDGTEVLANSWDGMRIRRSKVQMSVWNIICHYLLSKPHSLHSHIQLSKNSKPSSSKPPSFLLYLEHPQMLSFVPSLNSSPQNSELNRYFLKQLLINCLQNNIYFNLKEIIQYSLKFLIVYICMQKN